MVTLSNAAGPRNLGSNLAGLIESGNLLPIVSAESLDDLVLGGHDALIDRYAEVIGYPLRDRRELHRVAKYRNVEEKPEGYALKVEYLNVVATYLVDHAVRLGTAQAAVDEAVGEAEALKLSALARRLGFPRFSGDTPSPLEILANLPLPIYITTSPFTFIEEALSYAGKKPQTELCRWSPSLDGIESVLRPGRGAPDYRPSEKEPLVYHLYGLDRYEASLILTEDDYLDFLMALTQGRGTNHDPVHPLVKTALQSKALLLMGFSLSTWSFRALYRGLIKPMPTPPVYPRFCCLQLLDSELERRHYDHYLSREALIARVYWKGFDAFCRDDLTRQ